MADAVLVFSLAGHDFALPVACVRECLPLPALWRRAGQPPHVAGFFLLGGSTVPVLDLAALLGLRSPDLASTLEADGFYRHLILVGDAALLVDRAAEVADAASSAPAAPGDDRWQNGCVARMLMVRDAPVALLDPDRILRADERERLRRLTLAASDRAAAWSAAGDAGGAVRKDLPEPLDAG